jgi:hypothetical protein
MKPKPKKRRVPLDAIVKRINNRLSDRDHIIRRPRGRRHGRPPEFYIINFKTGELVANGLTAEQIERIARKDGVLQPFEEVKR